VNGRARPVKRGREPANGGVGGVGVGRTNEGRDPNPWIAASE
jgi:hypothetical protein